MTHEDRALAFYHDWWTFRGWSDGSAMKRLADEFRAVAADARREAMEDIAKHLESLRPAKNRHQIEPLFKMVADMVRQRIAAEENENDPGWT